LNTSRLEELHVVSPTRVAKVSWRLAKALVVADVAAAISSFRRNEDHIEDQLWFARANWWASQNSFFEG
jgi:hypothetical protein